MKLKSKAREYRAASHTLLAASMMAFAADIATLYGWLVVFGWDWQDPVHTGLPWLAPIGILTALAFAAGKASERFYFKAQDLEDKARIQASVQRLKRQADKAERRCV